MAPEPQSLQVVSKPLCESTTFALTLHHRPETEQEKGREGVNFVFLPFSRSPVWSRTSQGHERLAIGQAACENNPPSTQSV